jgi:hypothetical protein
MFFVSVLFVISATSYAKQLKFEIKSGVLNSLSPSLVR